MTATEAELVALREASLRDVEEASEKYVASLFTCDESNNTSDDAQMRFLAKHIEAMNARMQKPAFAQCVVQMLFLL